MPSRARINARDRTLPEVQMLIESHSELRKGKKGPDSHNTLLRSAIVILCASWELYCEQVAVEATFKIMRSLRLVEGLPEAIKKQLMLQVHDENVWKSTPLRLAGNGWKIVHINCVNQKCKDLNTPKAANIDQLFLHSVGLKDVSKSWSHGADEIDRLVRLRGAVAHRGADSDRVTKETVSHFKSVISKSISETDDALYDYLRQPSFVGKAPWQKTKKV